MISNSQAAAIRTSEVEITQKMVEASARCLRAYLADDGISYSESEILAEKLLRAGFAAAHSPCEVAQR
jgi:hypothetical protein